ncbi:hypothetical protein [Nonomuraea coxensis]|uniref:hypothetical protein n=1 Tax=Nonomuraea coxensis TaxID=404386 RepID=UPI00037DA542|nr:hypothetical protein [Nonomuraea coxensis]
MSIAPKGRPRTPGHRTPAEPAGDSGDGTALDLTEQSLLAGQAYEAGMPAILHRRRPRADGCLQHPARRASADLIDAQHADQVGLGWQYLWAYSANATDTIGQDTP